MQKLVAHESVLCSSCDTLNEDGLFLVQFVMPPYWVCHDCLLRICKSFADTTLAMGLEGLNGEALKIIGVTVVELE